MKNKTDLSLASFLVWYQTILFTSLRVDRSWPGKTRLKFPAILGHLLVKPSPDWKGEKRWEEPYVHNLEIEERWERKKPPNMHTIVSSASIHHSHDHDKAAACAVTFRCGGSLDGWPHRQSQPARLSGSSQEETPALLSLQSALHRANHQVTLALLWFTIERLP